MGGDLKHIRSILFTNNSPVLYINTPSSSCREFVKFKFHVGFITLPPYIVEYKKVLVGKIATIIHWGGGRERNAKLPMDNTMW